MKINEIYKNALFYEGRYLNIYGGSGSGKSYFAAQKIILRCLNEPGHKFLLLRKVGATLRLSTFSLLKKIINENGLDPIVNINLQQMSFYFANGSQIHHSGIDDVEKLKSIHGITSVWVEEMTEITKIEYDQINLRLRDESRYYRQIIGTYNPISIYHWIKAEHHDKQDSRRLIVKSIHKDNKFIPTEYSDVLANITDENYRLIYEQGEWGNITDDLIYTNYVIQSKPEEIGGLIYYGLDFGYNNPTALVQIIESGDTIYIKECMYKTHITNAELIDLLKPIVYENLIYCDAAEPNRIAEIKRAGIRAISAKKDVALGIDFMKRYKLVIDPESINFIEEIRNYRWASARDKTPVKFRDHLLDAARYAIFTHKRSSGIFR